MVDLQQLPVVDVHHHPFLNRGEISVEDFVNWTAFGGGSEQYMAEAGIDFTDEIRSELQRVKRDTVYFHRMVRDLANYLKVEPTVEAVVAQRNKVVKESGYTEYVRDLYAAAGITALVLDFGIPLPQLDVAEVRSELPVDVVPIYRIEPLIADLLKTDLGWSEFKQAYDDALVKALTEDGYYGLKSIIAYRTGLEVSPLSRTPDQGLQALDAIRRGLGGNSMKKLRDHLLCRALELSIEYDRPMQIHTGMGDFEVNLPLCRPAFLMDLLRFPTFRACRVILVHTGYPYQREAAYMANVLPRVYCDVSEGIPFAAHAARSIFSDVLEMAPVSKVVYGSDGFTVPEIAFTSALVGKQALAQVLNGLVADGFMGEDDAQRAARLILSENSRALYRLDG